jgi:hypothetical protein
MAPKSSAATEVIIKTRLCGPGLIPKVFLIFNRPPTVTKNCRIWLQAVQIKRLMFIAKRGPAAQRRYNPQMVVAAFPGSSLRNHRFAMKVMSISALRLLMTGLVSRFEELGWRSGRLWWCLRGPEERLTGFLKHIFRRWICLFQLSHYLVFSRLIVMHSISYILKNAKDGVCPIWNSQD